MSLFRVQRHRRDYSYVGVLVFPDDANYGFRRFIFASLGTGDGYDKQAKDTTCSVVRRAKVYEKGGNREFPSALFYFVSKLGSFSWDSLAKSRLPGFVNTRTSSRQFPRTSTRRLIRSITLSILETDSVVVALNIGEWNRPRNSFVNRVEVVLSCSGSDVPPNTQLIGFFSFVIGPMRSQKRGSRNFPRSSPRRSRRILFPNGLPILYEFFVATGTLRCSSYGTDWKAVRGARRYAEHVLPRHRTL